MPNWKYEMSGTARSRNGAANDQTWSVTGVIDDVKQGDFVKVPTMALQAAFHGLTSGKAVYGKPGLMDRGRRKLSEDNDCDGPYSITRLLIEVGRE